MSSFVLKIIAIISMVIDHTGYIAFHKFSFMNYLGRLSFPIFAFQLTEGYYHTKNLKNYFFRLFLFAIISQIPYMLFLSTFNADFHFNILFTLLFGLVTIYIYEKIYNKYIGILLVFLCCIIAHFTHLDYGWFGITIIFLFHLFKNKKIWMNTGFIFAVFIYYFSKYLINFNITYLYVISIDILALILLNLYNGQKGKDTKYLLYIFYPLHLLVLYALSFLF